jgi:hypothetical protein
MLSLIGFWFFTYKSVATISQKPEDLVSLTRLSAKSNEQQLSVNTTQALELHTCHNGRQYWIFVYHEPR